MAEMEKLSLLYEAFSKTVFWAAFSVLKDQEHSADVMQNVFLNAHRHMETLGALSAEQQRAWLYRAAVNKSIDFLRKNKRLVSVEDAGVNEADLGLGPEEAAERKELHFSVRQALMELPEKYREPLTLHYFAEMDYKEIAAMLALNEGTLKSRMSRGRALLEKALKKGGGFHA